MQSLVGGNALSQVGGADILDLVEFWPFPPCSFWRLGRENL
jgi:hypothetical protein